MPLIKHNFLSPEGEVGVWKTAEPTAELQAKLRLSEDECKHLEKMSANRLKEWVSARWLVHSLSGREERGKCLKDEYGKPYLEDSPYFISISHSLDRTAVIAAPSQVGIDIQEIVPKMERISSKFVNENEWSFVPKFGQNRLEMLHIIWGAKEAMYKAWGKKKIDFKEHLNVEAFEWNQEKINLKSSLKKSNIAMHFDVYAEKVDHFILVYVIEKYRYVS